MKRRIELTDRIVDAIPFASKGTRFYFDASLIGLAVRATRGSKTFIVQGRLNGRTKRISIGKCGIFSIEQAREIARQHLNLMAHGIDPIQVRRNHIAKSVTLREVFDEYLITRHLKPSTVQGYRNVMDVCFRDWKPLAVTSITKDMVEVRFRKLSEHKAQANKAMRVLRALLTFAAAKYEDAHGRPIISVNPVSRLSQLRAWHRIPRRQNTIRIDQLSAWYHAVMRLENTTIRDYLLVLLFTGLRKSEAANLLWEGVDLVGRTLTIPGDETKNHRPHMLPLTDFLYDLLAKRPRQIEYVFPNRELTGPLNDPRKSMYIVAKDSGVRFGLHDLRRTFITIAECLDIQYYALKRLLNHHDASDVTSGYIISSVERLREPMNMITNHILSCISRLPSDENIGSIRAGSSRVIPFRRPNRNHSR